MVEPKPQNVIHISNRYNEDKPKSYKFYVYLSKVLLKEKHPEIQLHGLGKATALCVKVAEILVRHGYCEIKKIENTTVELPENGANPAGDKTRRKIKLIIHLGKSKDFDKKTEDLKTQQNQNAAPKK